ncbi:hypothetical protein [Nocardioides sp. LML1-1-1.1]|uniref:hypothetical protein n=1 Tax=Nocardioides sp. LML1-1-1.1 TaxID=3135248 RepID=UPI0034206D6E
MTPTEPRPLRRGGYVLLGEPPALRAPDGRFLRLHQVPAGRGRALRRYLDRVGDVVAERERAAAATRWPVGRRRIAVPGRDRLSRLLADELRRSGAEVCADGADLVLDVRDAPGAPDRRPHSATPVLRGHREGEQFHLLPLVLDGTEATPDQVRRRRLAAAPAAPELATWLAAPVRTRPLRAPLRAVVAARCLTVLTDWAADAPALATHRRTLWILEPDLRAHGHVVLGFDEPAPREQP